MKENTKGHFAAKHPADRRPEPRVSEMVQREATDGSLSCAAAFRIAGECGADPSEAGFAMDFHEVRLVKCRLGLFGYSPENRIVKPADSVDGDLEAEIRGLLESNGKLSCKNAWALADRRSLPKMQIASACEALRIKVCACQLGAF